MHPDGKTLFFSSNGHLSIGGLVLEFLNTASTMVSITPHIVIVAQSGNGGASPCAYECRPDKQKLTPKNDIKPEANAITEAELNNSLDFIPGMTLKCSISA